MTDERREAAVFGAFEPNGDPIESIADLLKRNDLAFNREDGGIDLGIANGPTDYFMRYSWEPEDSLLSFICLFKMQFPKERLDELGRLILIINAELLIGHFQYLAEHEAVGYRSAMFLEEGEISDQQANALMQKGMSSCDAYLAAFRMVGTGISAPEAHKAATEISETEGTA